MVNNAYYFTLQPHNIQNTEMLIALLDFYGFEGLTEEKEIIIGYIPAGKLPVNAIEEIKTSLAVSGCNLNYTFEEIAEQNWNKLWESNFDPVVIDSRCVVRAPFHREFPKVQYQITIEPKMSFGTGHHFTTRLMLEKILETDIKGKNVLDMGCGTGVLAILASLCGAETITALDNDKWAFENTFENIQKNNKQNIQVILGGKESIPDTRYDIILANINRNILLDQLTEYSQKITFNGLLIISGILKEDIEILKESAQKYGFKSESDKILCNWVMLAFRRN